MTPTPARRPALPRHGSIRRYKSGCRCDPCTAKNTAEKAKERDAKRAREGKPVTRAPRNRKADPTTSSDPHASGDIGPIERAARAAFHDDDDAPVASLRREVVFAAARIMDNPAKPHLFSTQANVIRAFVGDMIALKPPKDGELDELRELMGSLGRPRGRRDNAAVPDTT